MWRAGRAPRSERSRPFPAPPPSCTCLEKMVSFFFFRCEFRKFRSSTTNQRQREVPTEEDAEEVEGRGRWSKGENQHDGWWWWRWEQLWGRKLRPRSRRPITARRHNRQISNHNSYSVSLIILVQTLWWIYVYFFHLLFCQNYLIFLSSTSGGSPPSFSFTLRHYWILVSKNLRACGR